MSSTRDLPSSLYPEIKPFKQQYLPVEHGHELWVQEFGKQGGKPVVHIHGGPGGGSTGDPDARRFDPAVYHIVIYDQRGAGESRPSASLEHNTTWDLVKDLEVIREHLQFESWILFGGSWGSTLALAYAQTHPDRVKALVLRGIFTLRKCELDFFYQQTPGSQFLFYDEYKLFEEQIPKDERSDMIQAFYKRLTSDDDAVRKKAAQAWTRWEMATSRLYVDPEYLARAEEGDFADKFARIETHYFVNEGFFAEGHLLDQNNVDKIRHLPCVIIQGRMDLVCPAITAFQLHEAWPEAKFVLVPDAGHSAKEPGIERALIEATDSFRDL